ncbi:MAG TPA: SGNH family hydrolase [Xanthobacteraceae bacterium]
MRVHGKSWRMSFGAVLVGVGEIVAAAGLTLALLSPAQAQFWSPFGAPRRPPAPIQQAPQQGYNPNYNQGYNPFGGFFGPPQDLPRREAPPDNSHAPSPQQHKADTPPTTSVVVVGDAMADWLAYGLEDAYSERPEIGVVRKHRTGSGLIRYDPKRDVDWAQTAREIIAAEKPKFVVMMIGTNDHQVIRERAPPPKPAAGAPGKPGTQAPPGQTAEAAPPTEDVPVPDAESPDQPAAAEAGRNTSPTGTFEFHTDQWEAAYVKRIDATIAALKSGGVPVLWIGLPAQRGPKATADSSYLNELYRARAERAGIIYVDVWDGFVDEQGRFSPQGPDFEGQTRRLRSADGIYFTKAGARKLAHYVEREIDRSMGNRAVPMALPSTIELSPPGAKPGGASSRPLAGPVVPLTVSLTPGAAEELLGGAKNPAAARPATPDPIANRVLTKGEAIAAPTGRADDFSWPRGGAATVTNEPMSQSPVASAPPAAPAAAPKVAPRPPAAASASAQATTATAAAQLDGPDDGKPKVAKKPALAPAAPAPTAPRPPAAIRPFATIPNIFR